jgi:hypothetical protein
VPLSEHEQRLLDQIERQLYAEDPKFASAVRSHDVKSHLLGRVKKFAVLLVAGLGALLGGVIVHSVVLGVAGFLVMLAAALVIARSLQRLSRGDAPAPLPKARTKRQPGASKGSLRERAEERFRRRFEDPDD